MHLGEKIATLRQSNHFTMRDLAEKLNIDKSSISLWESGKTEPTTSHLLKLSQIFKVTIEHLKGEKEDIEDIKVMENSLLMRDIPEMSPFRIDIYNYIAYIYESRSDYKKSIEYYEKALKISHIVMGKNHIQTGTIYNDLSLVTFDYDLALTYLKKAYTIYKRQNLDEKHPYIGSIFHNLGYIYRCKKEYEKSLKCYKKSYLIKIRNRKRCNIDIAKTLNNMGEVYRYLEQYDKALKNYLRCLKIWKKYLGENHSDVGVVYNNIGIIEFKLKHFDSAIEYYNKALDIFKFLNSNHECIANVYNNLGVFYKEQNIKDKALEYFNKALLIYTEIYNADNPKISTTISRINELS